MIQREVATELADRPHAYRGQRALQGVCVVCGAERADDLHQAWSEGLQHPRERASRGDQFAQREFG